MLERCGDEMAEQEAIFESLDLNPETGSLTAQHGGISYHLESQNGLPHARSVVSNLKGITAAARAYAAAEMLEQKNTSWPDEDEDENETIIDAIEFQKRMILESVWVNDDQSMTLWFDDGGLFDGHSIAVEFDGRTWTGSSIQG